MTAPDRRAMEGFISAIGGRRANDATARAQEVMYSAWDQTTARARIALAREALAISPLCADAFVLLAEEDARSAEEALEYYPRASRRESRRSGRKGSGRMRGISGASSKPDPTCPSRKLYPRVAMMQS